MRPEGWTAEEITTCAGLLDAADADEAHWRAGDWLAKVEPVGKGPWPRTGSRQRLADLAALVGRPVGFLLSLRATSYAWPSDTRSPAASWEVHRRYTLGGPQRATERRLELERLPRGPQGRVTAPTLLAWRASLRHPKPAAVTSLPTPVDPPHPVDAVEAACRRCCSLLADGRQLLEDVDELRREGLVDPEIVGSLDGLAGALEGLRGALMSDRSAVAA